MRVYNGVEQAEFIDYLISQPIRHRVWTSAKNLAPPGYDLQTV
jgi:hypothetical protein